MPETPTFVVNDRRKFTSEGELRHESSPALTDAPNRVVEASPSDSGDLGRQQPLNEPAAEPSSSLAELADLPESLDFDEAGPLDAPPALETESTLDDALPPGPTDEQAAEAARAYDATVERLDFAMRAANPGGERMPEMSFERLVQSLYTQALMMLGGAAEPGETPRVDILGARETIDMLSIVAGKSKGNLTASEDKLLQSALFDLRMGFLEITQALARQAAQRSAAPAAGLGGSSGPRIVR